MDKVWTIPIEDEHEAKPLVTHSRELVVEDGVWEQDYHFLDYDFAPLPFKARAYLDEDSTVIVNGDEGQSVSLADLPRPVLSYLQFRYDQVDGTIGYSRQTLWKRD